MPIDMTLADFRAMRYRVGFLPVHQMKLVLRARDYAVATEIWMESDMAKVKGYMMTSISYAKLAFPELQGEG
jgi:hypothetical protein